MEMLAAPPGKRWLGLRKRLHALIGLPRKVASRMATME